MSTPQQQIKPEALQSQDLARAARATWRQIKGQLPVTQHTQQLDSIFNELTYRVESSNVQPVQPGGGDGGSGMFGQQAQQQGQQGQYGQVQPS